MFKIATKRTLEWPVKINVPQDGGKVRAFIAKVQFEHLDQSEFEAIYADGGNDIEMLARVVVDWTEGQFQDETGAPLPFSQETLARLTNISYVRAAFVRAYLELQSGHEAARKN